MKSNLSVKVPGWSTWIIVPLRLFMGVTFVYAGLQKLSDPQYFNPAAIGYIGHQIVNFANGSPLHDLLVRVAVPHAMFFGGLVAFGELAIGLGVLLGLLLRPAAFFGLLINLTFFLSADWHVSPYFYGSDIVFCFCWLTLLLAGPANQPLPALDTLLVMRLVEHAAPRDQPRRAGLYEWVFGVKIGPDVSPMTPLSQRGPRPQMVPAGQRAQTAQLAQPPQPSASQYKMWQLEQARQQGRRNFVWGTLGGGAAMLALVWLAEAFHLLPGTGTSTNSVSDVPAATPTAGAPVIGETPSPSVGASGNVIARMSDVPVNHAVTFTLPSNNDPGILIHLNNGKFVAYDATCTHAGCPVDYDPTSHDLICPCHGAAFDPSQGAAVINGPAQTPLTTVPITIDQNAGTISLSQ